MVLKRGGNNSLFKVESHHQLVKKYIRATGKSTTIHNNRSLLQKVIAKAKYNQPKKPLPVMSKAAPSSIYFAQLNPKLHYIYYPPDVESLTSVIILQLLHGPIWLNN